MTKMMNIIEKTIKVLIIEDEMVLNIDVQNSLEEMGYKISGIESTAHGAINNIKNKRPNIIIVDIHLKGYIRGLELVKQIWEKHKIPVVFLTSYSGDLVIKNSMEFEPYAYLIKPSKERDIDTAIKIALDMITSNNI